MVISSNTYQLLMVIVDYNNPIVITTCHHHIIGFQDVNYNLYNHPIVDYWM